LTLRTAHAQSHQQKIRIKSVNALDCVASVLQQLRATPEGANNEQWPTAIRTIGVRVAYERAQTDFCGLAD
jgi:hypothetical protein